MQKPEQRAERGALSTNCCQRETLCEKMLDLKYTLGGILKQREYCEWSKNCGGQFYKL